LRNSEALLGKANLSLEKYAKDMREKTRRLKIQRNIWLASCVLALSLAGR
jgi:hypothetical protein